MARILSIIDGKFLAIFLAKAFIMSNGNTENVIKNSKKSRMIGIYSTNVLFNLLKRYLKLKNKEYKGSINTICSGVFICRALNIRRIYIEGEKFCCF